MQHLCIIVHNSQTLQQQTPIPLIASIISSLESTIRNLAAMQFPGSHQSIHFFVTSQPAYPLSSFQHDQLHLNWQLKNIKCQTLTYPGECIQNAVDHVSRFRIMTETQTLMGYREGYIHQPTLFLFITDKIPTRKIREMLKHQIKLRSEQSMLILQYCPPAPSDKYLQTEENFRKNIHNLKETQLIIEFAHKIGADLKFVVSYEGLIGTIWNAIQNFKPSLRIQLFPKQMNKKFTNQFASSSKSQRLESILGSGVLQLNAFPLRLWKIPIPFNLKYTQENNNLRIMSMQGLQFKVDFSKRYVDAISPFLPQNRYQLQKSPILQSLQNELTVQQNYPLFCEYRNSQILIGLLTLSRLGSQIRLYFGNFAQLNNILTIIKNRNPQKLLQSTLYSYLTSLPPFYLKFIKPFLDKLNLVINYSVFENITMTPQGIAHQKLEGIRAYEHRQMLRLKAINAQNHKSNTSQCCPIYSQHFSAYSQSLSSGSSTSVSLPPSNQIQTYFHQMLKSMAEFKMKIGITDYLSMSMIESVPMAHQLEKYTRMRKVGEEEFNENITMSLGNPYKKKRKMSDDTVIGEMPAKPEVNTGRQIESHKESQAHPIQNDHPHNHPHDHPHDQTNDPADDQEMQAQSNQDTPELQYKIHTDSEIILSNEVIDRINCIPVVKQVLISFDGSHIQPELLLRNEEILNRIKNMK